MKKLMTFGACLLVSCAQPILEPLLPMSRSSVVGGWVGHAVGEVELWKLNLRDDGKGSIALADHTNAPVIWRIQDWRLRSKGVEIKVDKKSALEAFTAFKLDTATGKLTLEVLRRQGPRKVVMWKEEPLLKRIDSINRQIDGQKGTEYGK